MLTIRFSRTGKRKQPYYRIIISEKTKDPWGTYLEILGTYNPRTKALELKTDRLKHWLSNGAETSNTIWNLLVDKGLVEGKKRKVSKISKAHAAKLAASNAKEAEPAPEAPKSEETPAPEETKPAE